MPERRQDLFIDLALERHDEVGQFGHRLPRPSVELGVMAARRRVDGDLALFTLEAEAEPFLRLATILALEGEADEMRRQVVGEPARRLGQQRRLASVRRVICQPARCRKAPTTST